MEASLQALECWEVTATLWSVYPSSAPLLSDVPVNLYQPALMGRGKPCSKVKSANFHDINILIMVDF